MPPGFKKGDSLIDLIDSNTASGVKNSSVKCATRVANILFLFYFDLFVNHTHTTHVLLNRKNVHVRCTDLSKLSIGLNVSVNVFFWSMSARQQVQVVPDLLPKVGWDRLWFYPQP